MEQRYTMIAGCGRVLRPAVFFDRDGTLNEDTGYPHKPEHLRWLPGAKEAIRLCNDAQCYVFVVTNQSGVARGYFDEAAVNVFHELMQRQLAGWGAHIDEFAYCPHLPGVARAEYAQSCGCRKPAPGMLTRLMTKWPVDRTRSFLIGDRSSDVAAAGAAKIEGILCCADNLMNLVGDALRRRDCAPS